MDRTLRIAVLGCVVALVVVAPGRLGRAQTEPPATAEVPTAEEVLEETLRQRQQPPAIGQPAAQPAGAAPATPQAEAQVVADPQIIGTAPGLPAPRLRREGESIPLRRGRLVRSPIDSQMLFAFEADGRTSAEAPLILMPCSALENMERHVAERGDQLVFLVSGQVFTYRGANYLLPSVWTIPPDRGNLRN